MSSVEEAAAVREEFYGRRIPEDNDKTLTVEYTETVEVDLEAVGPQPDIAEPIKTLDELFNKTSAQPPIYWSKADPTATAVGSKRPNEGGEEADAKRTKSS